MNAYRSFTPTDAVEAARAALSAADRQNVDVGDVRILSRDDRRNILVRAVARASGRAPRTIVVKATRAAGYDSAAPDAYETSGLIKEWAAAALLTARDHRPRLLAADVGRGVLVFEDLGADLPSLVKPLLEGSAAEAERALAAYATALGQLHVATFGCADEHAARIREALPGASVPPPGRDWARRTTARAAALLGGPLPEPEVEQVAERLKSPGPWLALVHRDPCPDNVLLRPDGAACLIDFEFAAPGHALLDTAYWRMGFPTCWCAGTVPSRVGVRLDATYRAAVAEAVPIAADDDAFRAESALIGVAWLLGSLDWLLEGAFVKDTAWGLSGRRSRILHYLDVTIADLAETSLLPGTRRMAADWREDLQGRWGDAAPLAPYPAFVDDTGSCSPDVPIRPPQPGSRP